MSRCNISTIRLYEAGFSRKDILELYRLLDWLMRLPDGLEREYKHQLNDYETQKLMPYVTSIQRIGREEGREEGRVQALRESLCDALETRFGAAPDDVREQVNLLEDATRLKELHRTAITCASLVDFQRVLAR
jgi:hypothetical protein